MKGYTKISRNPAAIELGVGLHLIFYKFEHKRVLVINSLHALYFHAFFQLSTFFKITIRKKMKTIIKMSKSFVKDQAQNFVEPDLDLNCL